MDENLELTLFLYKNAEMGLYSTNSLIKKIEKKENKIIRLLENELKEYESYYKKLERLLNKSNIDYKGSGVLAKMSVEINIAIETLKDNSDSAVAQMLVEGFTMGTVTTLSKINNYKDIVDKSLLKIAKNYLKFQEEEIEKLKEFM